MHVAAKARLLRCLAAILVAMLCMAQTPANPSLDPHEIVQRMGRAYDDIHDYQALFYKRERINGTLLPMEQIDLRFQEPYKIYMSWRTPHTGRTITYVKGENNNKIRVNPGGLLSLLRLSLDPLSPMAMRNSHHSVLKVGLRNAIALLWKEYEGVKKNHVALHFRGHSAVDDRPVYHLELICRDAQRDVCYAYRAEVWIDQDHHLPTKMQIYNWDNQLYAHYEYHDLELNPGLKPDAFRLSPPTPVSSPTAEAQDSD